MSTELYVIYSPKHTKGIAMWWRPNSAGYTDCIDSAGRYPQAEALAIQQSSHGGAIAVPESALEDLEPRRIVDLGWGWNGTTLKAFTEAAKE